MKQISAFLTFLLFAVTNAYPQPGSNDNTFNPTDIGFGMGDGANGIVYAIVVQPDGKVLIGGAFTTYNNTTRRHLVRLNPDGSVDTSFGTGYGANGTIKSIVLQPDGKVLIAGFFTSYDGVTRYKIARLHADGSLDTSFATGAIDGSIDVITLQPDGKMLIGGGFTAYNNTIRNRIARLNADGTLDMSFNPGTGADGYVLSIVVQSDGKVLIGGDFYTFNGVVHNNIVRLDADGSVDSGFNKGMGASSAIWSMVQQPDGKLLIAGDFTSYNGTARNSVARLNASGTLDTSFDPGNGVSGSIFTVYSIAFQSDGKALIAGNFSGYNGITRNCIARLNPQGGLDTSFDPGTGPSGAVNSIAVQGDGKVLVGGDLVRYSGIPRNGLARLNADSSLDTSFGTGTGATGAVLSMALQPDEKIVIGGDFSSYNGIPHNRIARVNADGSLDTSFDPGTALGGVTNPSVRAVSIQPDGKIMIAGDFTVYNGAVRNRIARLNGDGGLDPSFDPSEGANGYISAMVLQPDGKILIAGNFTSYNGFTRNRVARLNADGSLDTSFDPVTGASGSVYTIAIRADGRILIGGWFTTYDGSTRSIALLNTDGSLNTDFYAGTGANSYVYAIVVQPDGMVLIGGAFTSYNGTARHYIARLAANGTLDAGFKPGIGGDRQILAMALQPDGKIIIGGDFTYYNGTSYNRIVRLNENGTLDTSFSSGAGLDNSAPAMVLQPDGKLLIGGHFMSYDGIGRNRLARVLGKHDQTISFEALSAKTYGDAAFNLNAIATSGLTVSYASSNGNVAQISGSVVTMVGAGQTTITASQEGNSAYNAAPIVQQTLTVAKAALTATADNKSKSYGNENPLLTLSYSGFTNNDDVSDIVEPNISTTATASSSAGEYEITLSGGSAANYVLTLENGTLTIMKASQMITFGALETHSTGDPSFLLDAVSSSNLEISYSSSNPQVATVNGNKVTILAAGTTDITAAQIGNDNYQAAEPVVRSLVVTRSDQSINFTKIFDKVIGDATFTLEATTSSGLPVTFSSASDKISISGSSVTLLHPGQVTIAANQAGDELFNAAPDVLQSFCISPAKPDLVVIPESLELTSSSETGNQWYLNGILIPGAIDVTHLATETGSYTVTVTVDGCSSQPSDAYVNTILGLTEQTVRMNLYPVPAIETLHLKLLKPHPETLVSICNLQGMLIEEISTSEMDLDIIVKEYAAGSYILKVRQGGTIWYGRFVKS